jgi:hypothetical protein
MSPEDRELLQVLRRQQLDLQRSLARLDVQLDELETRAGVSPSPALPPPYVPPEYHLPLPPLPLHSLPPPPPESLPDLPILPEITRVEPDAPVTPDLPPAPKPSLEFQLGRWLTVIGAIFGVIALALLFSWKHAYIYGLLGPGGILGLSALAGIVVCILGERIERRGEGLRFVGRIITAMALAWLYLTAYTAYYYEPLRVIHSPLVAGFLLLLWSVYVLLLAERKQSQTLGVFAIALAYISTAINSIGAFTMGADLILAATAVLFLLRNGWAALTYFSLIGTYAALLRRLVVDENGALIFTTSHTIHFWPHAIYLIGAWLIFTAAVILSAAPTFRGGKRLAFLSLNNGALAGLLALTTYISGYDYGSVGRAFLDTGFLLLITSRFAGWARLEPERVMPAYAAQGLTLVTAGVITVYTGLTRGILLMLETFFLGSAAAFSADRVLIVSTYIAGFFATTFLMWEIGYHAHHPWLLGLGGAAIMLFNAWWSRGEIRHSRRTREVIVLSSSYYCALALGLIYTLLSTVFDESSLPPALAIATLALTFSIYLFELYELPPLAQTLLLCAQVLVLFPVDTGELLPRSTTAWVAVVTLILITWWSRQTVTRTGIWTLILNLVYSLALAALTAHAVHPYVSAQGWMIASSLLALAFLMYGAYTRVWPIAVVSQVFLGVSLSSFFFPSGFFDTPDLPWSYFPWDGWAAAIPIAVVFFTGRGLHQWLDLFPEIAGSLRVNLRAVAYAYQGIALAMVVRWVAALVPVPDQISTYLFLGALLLAWNTLRYPSTFGVRCSFVLTGIGMLLYLEYFTSNKLALATGLNALAVFAFLAQPGLLRRARTPLVTELESWSLILAAACTGWFFTSGWVETRIAPQYLTVGWALYSVFLFFFGLLVTERRLRWCGLGILVAAIIRVFACDFWGFSNGYRVLTFVVLMIITLGLGYLYARFSERLKTWL